MPYNKNVHVHKIKKSNNVTGIKTFYKGFWPTVLSVEPMVQCVVCRRLSSSVTFCIVAKRYVLAKKCLKE